MSTHNICFHGEIRKNVYFSVEKCGLFEVTSSIRLVHQKCLQRTIKNEGYQIEHFYNK